jgi:hypothetical protein
MAQSHSQNPVTMAEIPQIQTTNPTSGHEHFANQSA